MHQLRQSLAAIKKRSKRESKIIRDFNKIKIWESEEEKK